jgi:hypothetical protein
MRRSPREIRVAAAFEFETQEAAREAECLAHQHFAQFAHKKEWFRIPWQQVAVHFNTLGYKEGSFKSSD